MKNEQKQAITYTVGIPTYYGGPGLLKVVRRVLASKGVQPFRLIVCVDGNPLQPEIEAPLREWGVDVVLNEKRGGQLERIKQMIGLCNTDILVFTQDDILFEPNTLQEIVRAFENDTEATLVCGIGKLLPPRNFFESVVHVGSDLADAIGARWNNGDNHLRVGGRCLAFRMDMAKRLLISEAPLSSDVYFYFYNKALHGKFVVAEKAIYLLRSPDNISEHLKQSRKYQLIEKEVPAYLNRVGITNVLSPPFGIVASVFFREFFQKPIRLSLYMVLLVFTRCFGKNLYREKTRFWDTDISTKNI